MAEIEDDPGQGHPRPGRGITSIPYQTYSGIDLAGKAALSAYAKAGGRITTDPVTFQRLRDQALDHPEDFLDTDLNDYIHLVDGKDLSKLSTLRLTLKDKGPDDPAFSLQRVKGQSTDVMLGMLGLPTRLTGTAADAVGRYSEAAWFKQYIDQCASAEEAAIGRDLTPDEHQQLLVKKTVEAGVVHLASQTVPASGKGQAAANDNAVPAKGATADDIQRADSPSGDDENTDSDDGEYDADVTIGDITTDPNEDNVSLNGDVDAARNGIQPDQPAQPQAGADPKTEPKQAAFSTRSNIAIAGSTAAVLPATAAIGDAVAGWSAAAGNLVRGLAAGGEALGTGALGAGAVTALAAVGTFLVGVLWPTSTAGPELDMIPSQPMPPNPDDMRQPQPGLPPNFDDPRQHLPRPLPDLSNEINPQPNPVPQLDDQIEYFPDSPTNVGEFQQPLQSTTSRRNRKKKAEAEAAARGETPLKKEPTTPLDGLLPESEREPKDQRGNIPFSKASDALKPGDWIDLSKFTQKRSTKIRTFDDPETKYYIERDHGKHSDRFWKLRSPLGKRLKSITRYGKVLSD